MKISQKHIQYILLLLIVVIGVCAYQFGYVKYIEKANAVKEENKTIKARINELTDKETHRDEWNKGISDSEAEIKKILAKYGPGNTPEKSIMFVKSLEDTAGMKIPTISFNSDNQLFVSRDADENGVPTAELDSTYIAVNYTTSYEGLKACMDYINNYPERMNVETFTAAFNQEDGQLTGSMIINLYSVKDADHRYIAPSIGNIELGTDNIFGTVEQRGINPETGEPIENGENGGTGETGEGGATTD